MATIRHYKEFTRAQQEVYENLNAQQRDYIEFRRQGMSKADAYRNAYHYVGNNPRQSAYNLEKRTPQLVDLINVLFNGQMLDDLESAKDGELDRLLEAKKKQERAETVISRIGEADGETAERIQFYRDIISGKIKPKKVTKKFDQNHKLMYTQTVESDDVAVRMQAREKLDRILGLNSIATLEQFQIGSVEVKIVDATRKEEIAFDPVVDVPQGEADIEEVEEDE